MSAFTRKLILLIVACCLCTHSSIFAVPDILKKSRLVFVENKGQITDQFQKTRKDIDFKVDGSGVNVFIGSGQIHYQWTEQKGINEKLKTTIYRLDAVLLNTNKNVKPKVHNHQNYHERFYTENLNNVVARSFRKVIYPNIYNKIDWVIYFSDNKMKYDFVLHPGADVNDIQIKYNGATSLKKDNGSITITTPKGEIIEGAPYTYNHISNNTIPSTYNLSNDVLSFDVSTEANGNYTIDPTLEWGTYLGGSSNEFAYGLSTDTSNNIYMVGSSASSSNIATSGAHQTSLSGTKDAYVSKYSPAGVKTWSTYYGGNGSEIFFSIARNNDNDFLIAGTTDTSYNMATTGAHQTTHGGGGSDCFLVKLSPAGQRIWCTYYGGSDVEQQSDQFQVNVICDPLDNIYMVGNTKSDTGIATSGTAQTTRSGKFDAFIVKFDDAGTRLWGTYYGGAEDDNFRKAVFSNGKIYTTGVFFSGGLGTSGTHQTNIRSAGFSDALIAGFNASNGTRIWATYFGGTNEETSQGLGIDANNAIIISGSTRSTSNISSTSSFQSTHSGSYDAFIAKFDSTGNKIWGTYYGGQATDHSGDLIIDDADNIILTGNTGSTSGISTSGSHQPSLGSSGSQFDGFLAIFSPSGFRQWASYYGGEDNDYGFSIAGQASGHLYICGHTDSDTLIAYSGSQNTRGGNNDAFLAKFTPDTSVFIFQPFTQTVHCTEDSFILDYGVTSPFYTNNSFTVQLSNASGSFANPTVIGTINAYNNGQIPCGIPSNASGTGYRIRIIGTNPIDTSYDNGNNITIKPRPIKPTASSNSPICSNDTLKLYSTASTTGVTYIWQGPGSFYQIGQNVDRRFLHTSYSGNYTVTANLNGCVRIDTTFVTIIEAAQKPTVSSNGPLCVGDTLTLTATNISSGSTYSWSGPNNYSSTQQNPTINNVVLNQGGDYIFKVLKNGCLSSDTATVGISQRPLPVTATSNSPVCTNDSLKLFANSNTSGVTYSWQGPGSFTSNNKNPIRTNLSTNHSGSYIVTADLFGCNQKDTVNVSILQSPAKPIATSNSPLCSGDNLALYGSNITSGSSVSWAGPGSWSSTSDTANRNTISVNDSGDYILTTTLNGCEERDTVRVNITQSTTLNVNINVTQGTIVCPTADLDFTVSPTPPTGSKYTWTGPNGWSDTSANPTKTNVNYTDSGYYYVTVISGMCGLGIDTEKVRVVDTISKPNITTSNSICNGDTLTLDFSHPSVGINGYWDTPNGRDSSKKIIYHSADQSMTGTYILTVYSAGCIAKDTTNINIKPLPAIPTASNSGPICDGENLQLNSISSTPGVTYSWQGPINYSSLLQNPLISGASLTNNAGYYKVLSILNGCPSSTYDSTFVIINPNPEPNITTNSPVCEKGAIILFVDDTSTQSYNWRNTSGSFNASGASTTISNVQLGQGGAYIVNAKDNNTGCEGEDTSIVDIIPLPGKTNILHNSPICADDNLTLNVEDSSTNVTYNWYGPAGFTSTNKNTRRNNITLDHSGLYFLQVNRLGCSIKDSIDITVKPLPSIPNIANNGPLYIGDNLELTISNQQTNVTYQWTGPNGFSSIVPNPIEYNVNLQSQGTYTLVATLNGCISLSNTLLEIIADKTDDNRFILYPNPNNGNFRVKSILKHDQVMPFEIVNAIGMIVYKGEAISTNQILDAKVSVKDYLASGVYIFRIQIGGLTTEVPFSIIR